MTPITAAIRQATANHENISYIPRGNYFMFRKKTPDCDLWEHEQHDKRCTLELFRRASIAQQAAEILLGTKNKATMDCFYAVFEGATIRQAVTNAPIDKE